MFVRERSRGNIREGTFARRHGGENSREGTFARGDLQGHRMHVTRPPRPSTFSSGCYVLIIAQLYCKCAGDLFTRGFSASDFSSGGG